MASSLALERDRRCNAGNKLAQVLEKDEPDDFYKSTYGGFFDEAEDGGFESPVESESDDVDSDFDIDETEVVASDGEEETKRRRPSRLLTKAYKEPKRGPAVPRKPHQRRIKPVISESSLIARRLRERACGVGPKLPPRKPVKRPRKWRQGRVMGQEARLKEARETEKANLKSLERFMETEVEERKKRKWVVKKRTALSGPLVKYLSLTLTTPQPSPQTPHSPTRLEEREKSEDGERHSASFLVFPDEAPPSLPSTRPKPPAVCVVTGKPARYKDPLTGSYYHDAAAFQAIRKAYQLFLSELKPVNPSSTAANHSQPIAQQS